MLAFLEEECLCIDWHLVVGSRQVLDLPNAWNTIQVVVYVKVPPGVRRGSSGEIRNDKVCSVITDLFNKLSQQSSNVSPFEK